MRLSTQAVIVAVLLLAFANVPAAAQDAPAAQNPVYLPLVGVTNSTELIEDHQITLGEEVTTLPAPKGPSTAPDINPPPPPPAEPPQESGEQGQKESAAPDIWYGLLNETFEGTWPTSGWRVFDANGANYGERFWGRTSYTANNGSWSAWAAAGGASALNPATQNYGDNMQSWMIYGPVSLADAAAATLRFNLWNNSEPSFDFFGWYASVDGVNFYGQRASGYTGGWVTREMDLAAVPGYGSMLDNGSVWIAFIFTSDSSTALKGPFVDNVQVRKDKPQFTGYYYNGTNFETFKYSRWEDWPIQWNWGTGSPVPGVVATDNFSARWVGFPTFAAGKYTFYARSDDGVRIYVDNNPVVDGWYDHGMLSFSGDRTLTAGYHKVEVQYYDKTGGAAIEAWWVRKSP